MKRDTVKSVAIASIGYDQSSCTLEIKFEDGKLYDYAEVPAQLYCDFAASESKGHYFAAHIRNRFVYRKK